MDCSRDQSKKLQMYMALFRMFGQEPKISWLCNFSRAVLLKFCDLLLAQAIRRNYETMLFSFGRSQNCRKHVHQVLFSLLLQEFEEPGRPNVQTSVVTVSDSSVKIEDSRQDFVTWTRAHIFLLELAQEYQILELIFFKKNLDSKPK